jgi:hypothetical protein
MYSKRDSISALFNAAGCRFTNGWLVIHSGQLLQCPQRVLNIRNRFVTPIRFIGPILGESCIASQQGIVVHSIGVPFSKHNRITESLTISQSFGNTKSLLLPAKPLMIRGLSRKSSSSCSRVWRICLAFINVLHKFACSTRRPRISVSFLLRRKQFTAGIKV